MGKPQIYINVSQTIAVTIIGTAVFSYIFNKDLREDVNNVILGIRNNTIYAYKS